MFKYLVNMVRYHFKTLLRHPQGETIEKVVRLASSFPSFVNNAEIASLMEEITPEELKEVLSIFKK